MHGNTVSKTMRMHTYLDEFLWVEGAVVIPATRQWGRKNNPRRIHRLVPRKTEIRGEGQVGGEHRVSRVKE